MQLEENILFANRYRLERLLGRGGFSEVWLADDTLTSLKVALKVYAPGGGMDEHGVQLFSTEFSLVFNLNHGNLLKPTYYDTFERMPYLVLPYCRQGSAASLIGQMGEKEAWLFLRDIASGLEYLHGQEPPVIHQDIKPDNILMDVSGRYLLTDFGISIKARNTLRKSIMKTEGSVGTLAYMGPERFSKYPLPIKASDIFSLGATLYELLTGMVPFGEHGGLLLQHGAEIPVLEGEWSDELKAIIDLCLQKDTWERPSAMEIRIYCEQYLNGEIPVLPGKQVEKKTEPLPEVQPQEPELSDVPVVVQEDSKDESLEIQEVETPDPEIDNIADNASPMLPKVLKWGLPLVFLLGIVFFIFRSMEQRQEKEEVKAKAMEIEARYNEYLQYIHAGDSLTNLGNKSQGGDYEQFYLGAVGRYDAALRLEDEYRTAFPDVAGVSARKDSVQKKIEEIYNLFVSMAAEAEQTQDYDMAEIFYKRASGVKPESAVLKDFRARREAIQDSIAVHINN
ncbi:serine/threonine protein kinase [Parabacteroides johnsonii]|jgi:putative uncharacterized protein (fragment)|nr:serine/threonine protein kinase [Parabacteroides johnsonii]